MKKKPLFSLIVAAILFLMACAAPVSAQEGEFAIRLRRDFGYGAGSNVRGTFSIHLVGDETQVESVAFLIDSEVMALVEDSPFRFQFHTDQYGVGPHQLSARVYLQDGRVAVTRAVGMNFVSPEEERQGMVTLFVGLGAALIVPLVIYFLLQTFVFKRKPQQHRLQPGETRNYGPFGGTVCRKCGRAYSRHWWGVNLVVGKLDRCEHCGKWSMAVRATPEQLRAAEEAEIKSAQASQSALPVQQGAKDALEDTKYVDKL